LLSGISLLGVIVLRRAFNYYIEPAEEVVSSKPVTNLSLSEQKATQSDKEQLQQDDD
jgi:hypothetical protein